MKIYCENCKKYCGEIRDATLRKNISFVCDTCFNTLFISKPKDYNINQSNDILNVFDDIFNPK